MTAKNPFKKVILDLEASLNSIEEEISSIPDPSLNNVITELLSNVINNLSRKVEVPSDSKEEKVKALSNDLETIKSKLQSARETFIIPYKHIKLSASDEKSKDVEWVSRTIFLLLHRVDELQDKLKEKNTSTDNISSTSKTKNKTSWRDVPDINI
jgi:hypothetical protein